MSAGARAASAALRFYKAAVSPFLPRASVYAREAIDRYGFRRGAWLALSRLVRCHPFRPGGFDPVP